MATTNPRMQITLKPETKKIYEDFAEVMGIPASRAVVQILEESQESIMAITASLEAAKADPVKGLKGLKKLVENGLETAAESQIDIEDAIDAKRRRR